MPESEAELSLELQTFQELDIKYNDNYNDRDTVKYIDIKKIF